MGGATVLKVGDKFFDPPPLFGQWGGDKNIA